MGIKIMIDNIYEAFLSPPFLWTGLQHFQRETSGVSYHSHNTFQFTSLIKGSMVFEFSDNKSCEVSAGKTIVIAPDTRHRWHNPPKGESLAVVLFCGSFSPLNFGELGDWLSPNFKNEYWTIKTPVDLIREHSDKTSALIKKQNKARNIQLFARHIEFLGDLTNLFLEECEFTMIKEMSPEIIKTLHKMEHKYMDVSSLDDLAACANLSASHFSARFTAEVGRPPISYLNELRTNKAAEMLLYSKMPIKDIALRTGFISEHYFSRVFRKIKGIPPKAYRKSGDGAKSETLSKHLNELDAERLR
jgi:AraC-like DNA-binding protein